MQLFMWRNLHLLKIRADYIRMPFYFGVFPNMFALTPIVVIMNLPIYTCILWEMVEDNGRADDGQDVHGHALYLSFRSSSTTLKHFRIEISPSDKTFTLREEYVVLTCIPWNWQPEDSLENITSIPCCPHFRSILSLVSHCQTLERETSATRDREDRVLNLFFPDSVYNVINLKYFNRFSTHVYDEKCEVEYAVAKLESKYRNLPLTVSKPAF